MGLFGKKTLHWSFLFGFCCSQLLLIHVSLVCSRKVFIGSVNSGRRGQTFDLILLVGLSFMLVEKTNCLGTIHIIEKRRDFSVDFVLLRNSFRLLYCFVV